MTLCDNSTYNCYLTIFHFLMKVESTDEATKNSGMSGGDKSHVTCYNKSHFANKCTFPKKAKSDATDSMVMFVGVTFTGGPTDSKPTKIEPEAHTMDEYVGSVCNKVGQSVEWLLNSGATCGVTFDKTHMVDMKPSDREITIRNGDKVAAQVQGTVIC